MQGGCTFVDGEGFVAICVICGLFRIHDFCDRVSGSRIGQPGNALFRGGILDRVCHNVLRLAVCVERGGRALAGNFEGKRRADVCLQDEGAGRFGEFCGDKLAVCIGRADQLTVKSASGFARQGVDLCVCHRIAVCVFHIDHAVKADDHGIIGNCILCCHCNCLLRGGEAADEVVAEAAGEDCAAGRYGIGEGLAFVQIAGNVKGQRGDCIAGYLAGLFSGQQDALGFGVIAVCAGEAVGKSYSIIREVGIDPDLSVDVFHGGSIFCFERQRVGSAEDRFFVHGFQRDSRIGLVAVDDKGSAFHRFVAEAVTDADFHGV